MTKKLLGFVAGIKYNSEGIIIDWEYGKKELVGHCESPRIFPTEKQAQTFIDNKEHMGKPYIRPYYHYTTEDTL